MTSKICKLQYTFNDNGWWMQSFAGCDFLGSCVDRTDISNHILNDGVFWAGGVFAIYHNPRNISMGWIQFVSGNRYIVHKFVSFSSCCAGVDGIPIHIVLCGALFALSYKISSVLFQTNAEREALTVEIEFSSSTGLDKISLALFGSVLAGKDPAWAILGSFSISVGIESEFTYFPKVWGGCGCFKGSFDKL